MATQLYRSSQTVRLIFLVGMVLGGTLASTVFLLLWSLSSAHEYVIVPRVLPVFMDINKSQLGQLSKRGDGRERCVCGKGSNLVMESKHNGAMDGYGHSSFQVSQTSSLHSLDAPSVSPLLRQPVLQENMQQQTKQSTGRADILKKVKRDGVFKQQMDMDTDRGGIGLGGNRWAFQSLKNGKMRETLVMAVIIGGTELEWAKSVCVTWGRDTSHLMFYMESPSNINVEEAKGLGLQVVKLNASTKMHTRLALLQHLSEHYGKSHQWFVVVTEDTYVHMDQLEAVLGRLSPEEPLLLGLPPHCQVRGRHSGSSMVLNQALLSLLTDQLHLCLNENMKVADNHGSAGIEACVSENLNLHCSISSLMQAYFVEVEEGQTSISTRLLQSHNKLFSFLLTYSPLRQTKDMYILHYHYKKTQLMATVEKTKHLQQEVKDVCSSLGPSFPSAKDCSPTLPREVFQSHNQSSSKSLPNGVILTAAEPFHPKSIYDYLPWQYFDSKTIYNDQSSQPKHSLRAKSDVRKELQKVLNELVQTTAEELGRPIRFKRLVNGWVRHDPFIGNEYIFDYQLIVNRMMILKRSSLLHPFANNYISLKDKFVDSVTVNIVMPVSGVSQKLTEFMSMYEDLVFIPRDNVNLVLSVYGQEDVIKVNTILAQYRLRYEYVDVMVVEGEGEFSRSKAVHLGLSQLLPNDLAFVCDVDMVISPAFLDRCRSNAVQSSRVYFPEVFKHYNTDFVYWNRRKSSHSRISRATGYWAYYGFGMLCIYKSDYDSVGGIDTNIIGWGGEDISFFNSILEKGLQVMRAPDVGLNHRWHSKYCAKTLSAKQYEQCESSKVEDLADKRELARFVYGQLIPLKTTSAEARPTTASDAASQSYQEQ